MQTNEVAPNSAAGFQRRTSIWIFLLCVGLLAAVLCGLSLCLNGKTGIEKTLTKLVMPVGLGWLLLSGWTLCRAVYRDWMSLVAWGIVWCAATAASSPLLADLCLNYLESIEQPYDPARDPPLDVLVVLGGGTSEGPSRAQAAEAGDRVVYAARLYVQKHAKRLITTGEGFPGARRDPSQQTIEIWTELGIPRDAIDTLPGVNTYHEIQSLKEMLPQLKGQRVGLLTSALHLPRAMRLARAQGVQVIPVAANYRSAQQRILFADYLPSVQNLDRLSAAQHELMARIVRR